MKKYQKINTAKTQNHMQTHSIQHLQIKRGMWITGKKQKQRQVVAASSWPVAHRDALGTHTCHWSKFSLLVFKTALLQMADIINFCTCIWWEPPAGLPCFCTAEPTPVLSLLTYLLCFSPQTFYVSDWLATNEGHWWPLPAFEMSGWKVIERPSVGFTQSNNLIESRLWKWLVCSCAALMKPSPFSTSTLLPKHPLYNISNVKAV